MSFFFPRSRVAKYVCVLLTEELWAASFADCHTKVLSPSAVADLQLQSRVGRILLSTA